ncbi:MAG: D-2-hydroxyacid dehydrogenase [Planctomycetota bacterium]|nr:D-2-hydroxyacid dehydrogenase [Planctomycetota bacterium]
MNMIPRIPSLFLALLATGCIQAPKAPAPYDLLAVGNETGSVVAIPVTAETGRLVYLTDRLSDAERAELEELAPNVDFVSGLSANEALARAAEFHGADAHLLSSELVAAATNLRWAQSQTAGVGRYLAIEELVGNPDLVLTNMKGIHGPVIAEHVMAMLLSLSRDLPGYQRAQGLGEWDRAAGDGQWALAGSTLFVVGMGGIGTEVARRAHGFDMRVLATVRTSRKAPSYVDELGVGKDLERFLPQADVVVICLPLTSDTLGLFNAETIALMKPGAILINIARGPIVDTEALVAALESGKLGGAGLDVTDPEPLTPGHALWSRDDVIITPHVASSAALTGERRDALFHENLRRFGAGLPLLNVVDKQLGY